MDPSATPNRRAQSISSKKHFTSNTTKQLTVPSRRTPSFSSPSSSSLSSCSSLSTHSGESPLSPVTPLKFYGVPFSWEHLPGIPKKLISNKIKDSTTFKVLPLPPPAGSTPPGILRRRNSTTTRTNECFEIDPFLAALVVCSKDDDGHNHHQESNSFKVSSRSLLANKFGSPSLYMSCKRTCAVSESIVYLPRAKYDLINRRSR